MLYQRQQSLAPQCSIDVEGVWGPRVHGCGNDFDLTLLFQEVVLSIAPLGIAICLAAWRIWHLWQQDVIVASPLLHRLKMGGYSLLALLQMVLFVAQVSLQTPLTRATTAASCLGVVGSLVLGLASHLEHERSVRASTLLLLYLGYSIPVDAMRARTLWSMPRDVVPVAAVFTTFVVCKLVVLVLERARKVIRVGSRQPTPDERADIVSRGFLWWLLPMFSLGKKKLPLTAEALPDIEPKLTRPGDIRVEDDGDDDERLSKLSIFHHLFAVRGWLLMSAIPPRLCYTGFLFAQPFLVQRATEFMFEPFDSNTYKIGGSLIAAYVVVYVGIGVTQAFYRQCTARAITAIRADLVNKIYSHTLKLDISSHFRESASTLMSSDVERFATGSRNMHECWGCLIEVALGLWLLQQQLGVAIAATGGLTAAFIGLTCLIVAPVGARQNAWLKSVETRITATTQSLKAIKGVKMTGVTGTIREDILRLRKAEILGLRKFRNILLVVAWAGWIPVIMAPIVGFTIYNVVLGPQSGRVLTPAMVYRCLTLFSIFGNAVGSFIDSAVNTVTAIAALQRIDSFLHGDNARLDHRALLQSQSPQEDEMNLLFPRLRPAIPWIQLHRLSFGGRGPSPALRLHHAFAGWNADAPLIVQDVNLELTAPSVVAVVGPTGSGKSTLLQLLLGETRCAAGSVAVSNMRIGYCSQTPWLTNDSIRNNIIGSDVFEEEWYNTVIQATALEQDINMMASRDNTVVGNDGSNLSGGQKKRVALARAVYTRAPIVILDDAFNGLDGRTESSVLLALLGRQGLLRKQKSLVIWATSSAVQQAWVADRVISLTDSGSVRKRDSLLMAVTRTHALQERNFKDQDEDDDEIDGFERRPFSTMELVQGLVLGSLPKDVASTSNAHAAASDTLVYKYYIGVSGKRNFLIFIIMCIIFVIGITFNQIWVIRWAENNILHTYDNQAYYIGMYFGAGTMQLIAWTGAALFFLTSISEKSANRCHVALLDTVLRLVPCIYNLVPQSYGFPYQWQSTNHETRAPMSFFDSTTAGETINRFSQDLQLLDTELPYTLVGATLQFLTALGQFAIIIYGSPWSGLTLPVVGVALYLLQRAYLPTSRQLRLLEIEAKGPLFSHFLETLNGLSTIRALRWTKAFVHRNRDLVMVSQKPFYLLFSAQNWLNLVLDMITAGIAVTIMCVGVATKDQGNSTLGLALFSTAGFGASAKNMIQHWTQLEISMGAVERVRLFTQGTAAERHADKEKSDPRSWYRSGSIEFQNVSARYTPSSLLILRKISFYIKPGQRYAVCGRTGCGKSTLLGTLLRLVTIESGTILVDGADISKMNPDQVRSRFITLPQEPLLIHGTLRHNMQLYRRDCTDQDIIDALDEFGLWQTVQSKGGLDAPYTEDLLSHGQKQLFCFARSTLQNGNIVILDEPSSQADRSTEEKMEDAIRERFKHQTVLCVAHKLSTILSFDTVIVMDAGSIVETGSPYALLQDKWSLFSTLMRSQRAQED
ncbi:hypothetical protein PFICI_00148 [Pestalotiopsis fici W106-1]|uniref:Uncharacterized protein n=1 Tax=Pestalotiopsis fici (strain W106-1 / CGMCC3.15140) TaxID=1229662 RepID=W3XJZ4_PESFW|nr:uncharacterized protein PFICI_00148 [Pestalotiopsis fici W106-1]ETS86320.1 hypothetical protein PFICI_00148 [Pestalotiopsis fici W106-1]